MKMFKGSLIGAGFVCFSLMLISQAHAHPGGLNSEGCHRETATGGYHCHSGGGGSSGGSAPSAPSPTVPPVQAPSIAEPDSPSEIIIPGGSVPSSGSNSSSASTRAAAGSAPSSLAYTGLDSGSAALGSLGAILVGWRLKIRNRVRPNPQRWDLLAEESRRQKLLG